MEKASDHETCNPTTPSAQEASAPAPASASPASPQQTPYMTLSRAQRLQLQLLIGLATITSPLTATIYLPLLPLLRAQFHASAQAINLTLTLYIVFQALSPALFGPLSDALGRRPVYLFTLALYALSNVGLAANRKSYAALLALRAFQSLGASAAYAVSYGVVADVCAPGERGRVLGPVGMALNLGACVGPVVGGWVASERGDAEWVFWALVIVGAVLWAGIGVLLPETMGMMPRRGSEGLQQNGWDRRWLSVGKRWLVERCSSGEDPGPDGARQEGCELRRQNRTIFQRCRLSNPFACLRIIFHLDTFLVLWMHGSFYTVDYSLVAAMPDIYKEIYHFNELHTGLAYLPRGIGIIIGSYCNGKLMDYNFKATARSISWNTDGISGIDLKDFPIERARSRGSFWLLATSTVTLVSFGWIVSNHVHVSLPLILQFVQGFWGTCFYTIYNTLLVDIFPESPSTAAAAASIVRCGMAATGVAILQPLLDVAGLGWYFTFLGIWSGVFGSVSVYLIREKGTCWRLRRLPSRDR